MATNDARPVQRGFISTWMHRITSALFWILLSLFVSIIIEWIGMNSSWKEEGLKHSSAMLEQELTYINEDFKQSLLVASPIVFVTSLAKDARKTLFTDTGIERSSRKILSDKKKHWFVAGVAEHILAAANITQVFAARMAILILALPAFFMLGGVAIVQGLAERDIRKWSYGRERAGVYHHAKRAVPFFLVAPWFIYLSMPNSIHPNYVILPFAVLFAIGLYLMTYLYKKHV